MPDGNTHLFLASTVIETFLEKRGKNLQRRTIHGASPSEAIDSMVVLAKLYTRVVSRKF